MDVGSARKTCFLFLRTTDQPVEGKLKMQDAGSLLVPSLAFMVWALFGCGGQSDMIVLVADGAGPEMGGVQVACSPTASSFDDEQARLSAGGQGSASQPLQVSIDGQPAMLDDGAGHRSRVVVREGGKSSLGYLEAGPRHFAVTSSSGTPVFEGDAQVPGGGVLWLFLFGPAGAQQGRFVATPDFPAVGNQHLTVVNLARTGQSLEVVSCDDGATCTPLSPVLALGDLFDTEVPAGAGQTGYRVVPSPALPAPPLLTFEDAASSAVLMAAPVYISDQGQLLFGFQ